MESSSVVNVPAHECDLLSLLLRDSHVKDEGCYSATIIRVSTYVEVSSGGNRSHLMDWDTFLSWYAIFYFPFCRSF